jgi:hypothetical protein
MSSTGYDGKCPHCNATPPAREVAEGWCDTCGKRLPSNFAPWIKRTAPEPPPPAAQPGAGAAWPVWPAGLALTGIMGAALALVSRVW